MQYQRATVQRIKDPDKELRAALPLAPGPHVLPSRRCWASPHGGLCEQDSSPGKEGQELQHRARSTHPTTGLLLSTSTTPYLPQQHSQHPVPVSPSFGHLSSYPTPLSLLFSLGIPLLLNLPSPVSTPLHGHSPCLHFRNPELTQHIQHAHRGVRARVCARRLSLSTLLRQASRSHYQIPGPPPPPHWPQALPEAADAEGDNKS